MYYEQTFDLAYRSPLAKVLSLLQYNGIFAVSCFLGFSVAVESHLSSL